MLSIHDIVVLTPHSQRPGIADRRLLNRIFRVIGRNAEIAQIEAVIGGEIHIINDNDYTFTPAGKFLSNTFEKNQFGTNCRVTWERHFAIEAEKQIAVQKVHVEAAAKKAEKEKAEKEKREKAAADLLAGKGDVDAVAKSIANHERAKGIGFWDTMMIQPAFRPGSVFVWDEMKFPGKRGIGY